MRCRDSPTLPTQTHRAPVSKHKHTHTHCRYCVGCGSIICFPSRCDWALGADRGSVSKWEAQTQTEPAAVAAADLRSADLEGLARSLGGWTQPTARPRSQHWHTHHPAENQEAQGGCMQSPALQKVQQICGYLVTCQTSSAVCWHFPPSPNTHI